MSFIDDFYNEIKEEITGVVRLNLEGFLEDITKETRLFLEESGEDLRRWLSLVKSKGLTDRDFVWLLKSKKDLMELASLKKAGLSLVKIEDTRNKILGIIARGALSIAVKGIL